MAKKKKRARKSLVSRALDWTAIGIGVSPLIVQGLEKLPSGNVDAFVKTVADGYTGGVYGSGKIYLPTVMYWYGPIAGAILFRKSMSLLMRFAKGR